MKGIDDPMNPAQEETTENNVSEPKDISPNEGGGIIKKILKEGKGWWQFDYSQYNDYQLFYL